MNKDQLKKALKPVIIECVREALYEEGVLSSIISEVVHGLNANVITEAAPPPKKRRAPDKGISSVRAKHNESAKTNLKNKRKQLLEAVSAGAYNGVDLFENVTPAPTDAGSSMGSPLADIGPADPGIDISGIMAVGGKKWKALTGQN